MIEKKLLLGVCCVFMFGAMEAATSDVTGETGPVETQATLKMDEIRGAIEASGINQKQGEELFAAIAALEEQMVGIIKAETVRLCGSSANPLLTNLVGQIDRCATLQQIGAIEIDNKDEAIAAREIIEFINEAIDYEYKFFAESLLGEYREMVERATKKSKVKSCFQGDMVMWEGGNGSIDLIFPNRIDLLGNYGTYKGTFWETLEREEPDMGKGQARWKLHLSAWPSSATRIYAAVGRTLDDERRESAIDYKITPSLINMRGLYWVAQYRHNRKEGYSQFGKWITVYPYEGREGETSIRLAGKIDNALAHAIKSEFIKSGDFVQLYGDAVVGESGGLFSRDEHGGRWAPIDEMSAPNPFQASEPRMRVRYRGADFNHEAFLKSGQVEKNEEEMFGYFNKGDGIDVEKFNALRRKMEHLKKRD